MRAGLATAAAIAGLAALAGCDAASPELGLDALFQVAGAQYRPGPFPAASGGPMTLAVSTQRNILAIGELDQPLRGTMEPGTRGAIIGVEGIDGAWIIPASFPDVEAPGFPTAKATVGVADDFPPGPFELLLAATDADGRIGVAAAQTTMAEPSPPPEGELVIGLDWEGRADLDLHVVDALGGEAWSDDPNTWVPPPPGEPVDPFAFMTGGILDHDGNKDCRQDGDPNEHVIWQMPPPDGDYVVRVDVRSLCGDAIAGWYVAAYRSGTLVTAARGVSTPDEVQLPHGMGAGALALRFTCSAAGCTPR
jgi:hypothetical protein